VQKALVVCLDGVRHDVLQSSRTPALDGTALAGLDTRLAPTSRIPKSGMG
jgi:predicted AlkP superfamily pyrophosphatase or phosphodiesterase